MVFGDPDMDELCVFSDAQRVAQVVSNLLRLSMRVIRTTRGCSLLICGSLSNASKFSPPETGVITCTVGLRPLAASHHPWELEPLDAAVDWPKLPDSTARQLQEHLRAIDVASPQWRQLQISVRCAHTQTCSLGMYARTLLACCAEITVPESAPPIRRSSSR